MLNTDKSYTFLLSHSSRSRIFLKRIEVSKKLLHGGLLSFALILGFSAMGAGVYGVYSLIPANAEMAANPLKNQISAQLPAQQESFDYSRPYDSESYTVNSGGPFNADENDTENSEVEKQLQVIQTTGNPANIPSIWAHMGKINNEFGFRRNPFGGRTYEFHAGMDIDGERGDLVVAPANGVVTEAGWKGGYGQMVEIDHGNGLKTRYGHLSKIDVEVGDNITRGQLLALVGSTGRSTGPHLHYELRLNDRPINPRHFLPPEAMQLKKSEG